MGDAGEASESRLLATYAPGHDDDLHADVVKVGHHGSRYASNRGIRRRRSFADSGDFRWPAQTRSVTGDDHH